MTDFYRPQNAIETLRHVDEGVYASRYQREKNACVERLLMHCDLRDKNVLEVGCGAGYWTERLLARGAHVTAIDLRPHLIEAARSRLAKSPMADRATFYCGQVDEVISTDTFFDHVFFKDVIEHVDEDLSLLRVLSSRMRSGATMLVSTHNAFSLNFVIEGAWERIIKRNRTWLGWDPTHVRFYTPRVLRSLAKKAGLRPVHKNGCYHIPYRFFFARMGLSRLEPSWMHALDRISDDNMLANMGWSTHLLLKKE